MLFTETYKELDNPSKGLYKEKGSKFIAYAFPIYTEEAVKEKIIEIKKLEKSARHHCYAFILHPDKSSIRENDDGEPKSTAGKPILAQIESNDLTNTLIIVVRYFGGVKLGITGLIRSYKTAASNAISNSNIITKKIKEIYELIFIYEEINNVMRIIKNENIKIIKKEIDLNCRITISINKKNSDKIIRKFKDNHKVQTQYIKTI